MTRARERHRSRGLTVVELLIAMSVAAVIIGVVTQTFIVSTRTVERESRQSDLHFAAQRAIRNLSDDASEAWAVLSAFTVPSTTGWSDSGHTYTTTASTDDPSTPEDDRFTVVFLLPSLERVGPTTQTVLDASAKSIGAFDAVVWTFVETTGQSDTCQRRYDVRRAVYPAAAVRDASISYNASGNTLTVGTRSCTLVRRYTATTVCQGAIQASEDEASWSGTGPEPIGRQARPAITLKNRDGIVVGRSPTASSGSELSGSVPPPSRTGQLTSVELADVPLLRGTTTRVSVTDASLADFRVAVWDQVAATYSGRADPGGRVSLYTSTDNRFRNKRDWQ